MFVCAVLTTIIIGTGRGAIALALNIAALIVIWGLFWKYARTHEVLVESRIMFKHRIRTLRGLNRYSSVASPDKQISKLYAFSIKGISKTGIIDFGKSRFGVVIGCETRWLDDEELYLNTSTYQGCAGS